VLSIETDEILASNLDRGLTYKMISNSPQFHFVLELFVPKNLSADRIQARVDDFCDFNARFLDLHSRNTFRKAFDKFFGVIVKNW
jgi:hypothetical protein